MNYYNEFNKFKAQWLRNLIAAGHLPQGDVDDRSIVDVAPSDLAGYTQCHFFAGIGLWAYSARLAGWSDDRELWTASLPCQPWSVSGEQKGADDDRHLWPHILRLIRACRPSSYMGEQVTGGISRGWLDGVLDDMEGIDYSARAAVVPACSVNAPIRGDRLWIVASPAGVRREERGLHAARSEEEGIQKATDWTGDVCQVAGWDGKVRRVKSGTPLLVDGYPNRVSALHAIGDAIVPQVAAAVIRAYMMGDA